MELTRENYEELLAARALGALPDDDVRELEAAEAADDALRELGVELNDAAALLAYSVDPIEPPAALRSRILDSTRIRTAAPRRVESAATAGLGRPENVVPFPRRPSSNRAVWAKRIAVIAAMLLVVVFAGAILQQMRRAGEAAQALVQSNQRVQDLERQLNDERELREMLSDPNSSMMPLNSTGEAQAANAKFIYNRSTGRGMLLAEKMPMPPAGMAYQLWFIVDGKPIPSQTFKPRNNGQGEMHTQMPVAGMDKATLAVTMEKETGVAQPEGKMYLKS
jgi:hypothetical protein